jgi:hypothetical protein
LFGFLAEGVGGSQEGHEKAVLQRGGRAGEFGAGIHGRNIVVVTMVVKRKKPCGPAVRRVERLRSFAALRMAG